MGASDEPALSRRERQIMDIVYRRGQASAAEVRADLAEPPSYSSVRTILRILEEKGVLHHHQDGPRYVYAPTVPAETARRSAVRRLLATFFDDSAEQAVTALLDMSATDLTDDELDRLARRIDQARSEGR